MNRFGETALLNRRLPALFDCNRVRGLFGPSLKITADD